MKVFKFDPKTGKRGEQIWTKQRIQWTGQSVRYQAEHGIIEPIECVIPSVYGQEWNLYVDAGGLDHDYSDVSYLCEEWICFCIGEMRCGEEPAYWDWTILPPKSLIVKKEVA
jgi:hypothetical protein